MESNEAVSCLEALSKDTRLKIYRYLVRAGREGAPVGELQKKLEIPGSTLSHHISKMVRANLVIQERQSTTLICKANYEMMDSLINFLTECCCEGNP